MKKLIVRQQVINCNKETCGACEFRCLPPGNDYEGDYCDFWQEFLSRNGKFVCRCYQCKNAEMSK